MIVNAGCDRVEDRGFSGISSARDDRDTLSDAEAADPARLDLLVRRRCERHRAFHRQFGLRFSWQNASVRQKRAILARLQPLPQFPLLVCQFDHVADSRAVKVIDKRFHRLRHVSDQHRDRLLDPLSRQLHLKPHAQAHLRRSDLLRRKMNDASSAPVPIILSRSHRKIRRVPFQNLSARVSHVIVPRLFRRLVPVVQLFVHRLQIRNKLPVAIIRHRRFICVDPQAFRRDPAQDCRSVQRHFVGEPHGK